VPEPVTLVLGGLAIYSLFKGSGTTPVPTNRQLGAAPSGATANLTPIGGSSGSGPDSLWATATGNVNGEAGVSLVTAHQALTVPSDLVAELDASSAMAARLYAQLNPVDFQRFLDQYADRIMLRNDLYFERLTNPQSPSDQIQPTPAMIAGMGNAAYKLAQALNGVAVGKSVDVFGVAGSIAGQIPGMNQDFLSSLQGAAMSYRAITSLNDVLTLASANNTTVMNFATMTGAGAYPGLAALPLSGVLMAAGLVIDIAFTIIGDKPDIQKAIDVALDVASLAVLFIPVIGVIIAIVIQLVKFIIDLFGDDLFGGGLTHEQREALEAAAYGEAINPIYKQVSDSYTPRELYETLVRWGAPECGGQQKPNEQARTMISGVWLRKGDVVRAQGLPFIVPADTLLIPGHVPCPGVPFGMSNDEQAEALAVYASVNGAYADAVVGIAESREVQFEEPLVKLIQARSAPMRDFIVKYKLNLNQIDMIATEYRAQPRLNDMARSFGFTTWQEFFAGVVNDEWQRFNHTHTNGTLTDFANENDFPTMFAFRARALSSYESFYQRVINATNTLLANTLTVVQGNQAATAAGLMVSAP
jgi:hypothetical protein